MGWGGDHSALGEIWEDLLSGDGVGLLVYLCVGVQSRQHDHLITTGPSNQDLQEEPR